MEKQQITKRIAYKKRKYCVVEVVETITLDLCELVFREVNLYDERGAKIIGRHRVLVMETYTEKVEVLGEDGQPLLVGSGEFVSKERAS